MVKVRSAFAAVVNWWSEHRWVDGAFVATLIAAYGVMVWLGLFDAPLSWIDRPQRTGLYQTVAEVGALIFGFATAAIAFFYSARDGDRLSLLTRVHGHGLVKTWRATVSGPLICVGTALVCLVGDVREEPGPYGWLLLAGLAFMFARLVRLQWLFGQVLGLATHDTTEPDRTKAGAVVANPGRRKRTPL